jgi:Fe-S-cluster-containing hydrogenase component 2
MSEANVQGTQPTKKPVPKSDPALKRGQRTSRWVRWTVLAAVLGAVTTIGIGHQLGWSVVGVDALCPFGGIETLWSLMIGGTLLQRIAVSSVILLVGVVATALLFRRAFCGYVCPLGAIQEFFGIIGRKLFGKHRPHVPVALDRVARYLKYVVLAGFTIWTWQAASLVIRPYDPWVAWMHITSAELWAEFAVGTVVLGVSVAGSFVYERFFCKYACPMGALLAIMAPLSVFKVRRDESVCISCGSCDAICPVNVDVSTGGTVNDPECINCNECVNVCPAKGALEVTAPGKSKPARTVSPGAVLAGVAVILGLVIGSTTIAGAFAWSPLKAVETIQPGETFNAEEIKGSMTFAEVSKATGIPEKAFIEHFKITEADMGKPMKEIAEEHGFDVETGVREWVESEMAGQAPK